MTVSELRTLVDNLDEYIHVPDGIDRLKKMVLHLAVSGQLVPQDPVEGTGEELYQQIQAEKDELVEQGKIKKQKLQNPITDVEITYDTPGSWRWSRLDDIANLITDGTHHTPKYQSKGVPFLSIKDISAGSLDFSNCKFISEDEHKSINERCNPERGDILFCRIGTLGRPVVVDIEGPFSIFVSLGLIKFSHNFISSEYLRLYLEAPETYRQYSRIMAGGSHTNKLNLASMRSLVVALPPLAEQKRIVAKVDSIFALIDQLSAAYAAEQAERSKLVASSLAQLASGDVAATDSLALTRLSEIIRTKADAKTLRQAILHLAVSGQLVPQNPAEGTGEELYQQIQAEKAGLIEQGKIKKQKPLSEISGDEIPFVIPDSWRWVRQADVFDITSSKRVMQADWKTSGVPFLRARDLTNAIKTNEIESDIFVSRDYFESVRESFGVPIPGDLMVSGVGTIGTPYIVKYSDEFYFKDATILWFKNVSSINPYFAKQVLLSSFMKKKVKSQSQGTTVDTYTIANARLNIIPLPPLAEQKRIVAKTAQLLDLVTELERHLEK